MANTMACEPPPPHILFDEAALAEVSGGERGEETSRASSDLEHVEDLLDRCWRELDTVDLNVKLTDVIRLLEFKHKLGPGQQAEHVFWDLIAEIRRDELRDYGNNRTSDPRGETDDS